MKQLRSYILFLLLIWMALPAWAQPGTDPKNRLEIISSDLFEFGEFDGKKIRKLVGNVHLMQDSTEMFCDSAYHYVDSKEDTPVIHAIKRAFATLTSFFSAYASYTRCYTSHARRVCADNHGVKRWITETKNN